MLRHIFFACLTLLLCMPSATALPFACQAALGSGACASDENYDGDARCDSREVIYSATAVLVWTPTHSIMLQGYDYCLSTAPGSERAGDGMHVWVMGAGNPHWAHASWEDSRTDAGAHCALGVEAFQPTTGYHAVAAPCPVSPADPGWGGLLP